MVAECAVAATYSEPLDLKRTRRSGKQAQRQVRGLVSISYAPALSLGWYHSSPVLSDIKELNALYAKLEWAERQIDNLQSDWSAYEKDSHPVIHEDDPQTGDRVYRIKHVFPIPDRFPLQIGDILHNLRSALDHVIFRLARKAASGMPGFDQALYFPIGENLANFESRLARALEFKPPSGGKVQRLRPEAVKAIRSYEPYVGGMCGKLWLLHKLNIIDKHHLLLTASSENSRRTMSPCQIEEIMHNLLGVTEKYSPEVERVAFLTDPKIIHAFPLKAGDIIERIPKTEINENIYFAFDITFAEPEIVERERAILLLHQIASMIRDIIRSFNEQNLFD
jgi:hypothetical protein